MKGIILAGGSGTRMYPITKSISKQLLPVYDKPMIYYPLSTLMLAGIKDILIITNPEFITFFEKLLGDGSHLGISIKYEKQTEPKGIAEAFLIGEHFIGDSEVCLILGDNVFYGEGFTQMLQECTKIKNGAKIFGYYVQNPTSFGVVEFDEHENVISIEEKPEKPKSNYVVPGLYFYDTQVTKIAKKLTYSQRGELEITDINKEYMMRGDLKVELLGRGFAWLDTGTSEGLHEASSFVQTIQKRQGLYISCIEEIAYRMNYICQNQLHELAKGLKNTDYGEYLINLSNERKL
ncbi:glucose-1-phosphate thymidylyltransferase RfbA [Methanolobus vulcani]|uniref:glucose-1-phosphate thymidylyltransferase n=1 Tax=Methanolobus vulcani TaxID=38026 RepID=A0A7Z8KMQ2_9EURY|nr:glucose-1-phosphate thymidylyltransferase RfbA [Methanolobus vulcani]TQD23857.1 glucose-1-phosphate thymidylyltransferase RfbA [Methanolobus vulcani]